MSVEVCDDVFVEALREAGAMFGSRTSGDHRNDSDVDIGACWARVAPAAWDVAVPDGVDLVVLNTVPLELAGRIALEGVVLFDDDSPRECTGSPTPARSGSTNAPVSNEPA